MRFLLDTHAFLWFISGDTKISDQARNLIENSRNSIMVSSASMWEIGIKVSPGKLILKYPFNMLFPRQTEINGFRILHIQHPHVTQLISLPFHHRDPFDRLLAAQGIAESMPIISSDSSFDLYPVEKLW